MPLGIEVGLGPGDIVAAGDPAPPKKEQNRPHFLAHVYCGQTTGWIKIALGAEVGLGPGHRWNPAPRKKGHSRSQFYAHLLLSKLVAMATTLRHSIWVMSSSDNVTLKTHA